MATDRSQDSDSNPLSSSATLTDRVKARVAEAGRDLDNRARRSNARHKHLRPTTLTKAAGSLIDNSADQREAQSLRRVYCEMRALYRSYRRRAGTPAVPELRSAVQDFQRGRSLTSLVHIASFLDDRKLLSW